MEKIQGTEVETLLEQNPTFTLAKEAIGRGKLEEAERILIGLLNSDSKPPADVQLASYSQLIRIAAEVRNFEKIPGLIEKVKAIPLKTDAEKHQFANCLYMTGIGWYYAGNNDEAKKCFTQSLQLAERLGSDLPSYNKLMLAQILRAEGYYQDALDIVLPLKDYAKEINNTFLFGTLTVAEGDILRKQGFFRKAIVAYETGRETFNQNKSSSSFHYVLWAIGTCYAALEEHEKAQIYLNMTLNNTEGVEFWRINILSKMTLAEMYTVTGDYVKADNLYKKIIEKIGPDEQSYYGRRALRGQTLLAIKKGEFDAANEMIDKLVIIAVRDKKQKEIMRLRLLKAEVLLRTGEAAQHDEAIAMLQEALAFFKQQGSIRHQSICLELLARLDSRSGFPTDSSRKVLEVIELTNDVSLERLHLRAELASLVLDRKLGRSVNTNKMDVLLRTVLKLNAQPERMVLARFTAATYEDWVKELASLDAHGQRFVNEFFEDFHFVNHQSMDLEIDKNSHYVREKHLGEIPFHNKFTLMRILLLLAESPGKEYSKEQLAKDIWGQDYNPLRHDNNIYININRLRKLIEPNPRESRYVMNGAQGYYMNPAMKVNISTKISDVAPRLQNPKRTLEENA